MKAQSSWIILIVVFFLNSCNSDRQVNTIETLNSIQQLDQIDTFYLTDVRNIAYTHDDWVISDFFENKIIHLDERNLNFLYSFGTIGKGPGETSGMGRFCAQGDSSFVMNPAGGSIELFYKEKYLSTIKKEEFKFYGITRFDYYNGIFYLPAHDLQSRIMIYNSHHDTIHYIGRNEFQKDIDQFNHVLLYGNKLLSISAVEPRILIYTSEGKLLSDYFYGDIELISEFMKYHSIYPSPPDGNSFQIIAQDVVNLGDDLYVLASSISENGENEIRHIIQINIENILEPIVGGIYELEHGYYTSIAVQENSILAYDAHAQHKALKLFSLK